MSCLIIAEAGVNHNGDMRLAKELIDAAKESGADCVKFQTFKTESIVTKSGKKAHYQNQNLHNSESQFEMLKKLELTHENFYELASYCQNLGIIFLSTPFDLESIEFLKSLNTHFWKLPSGDINNYPYLVRIAETHMPIILSTGMSTIREIDEAISILNEYGAGCITLLHCTTEYPAPIEEVNLKAMNTLHDLFNLQVGYSDHTKGIHVPIAAVAMGASVIEKHFTLDKMMKGPDHLASIEPRELREMVVGIREIELALGDGEKKPTQSELENITIVRKSIVAKKYIEHGQLLTEDNITVKRPGNGISPMRWNQVLGTIAKRSFNEDELIEL